MRRLAVLAAALWLVAALVSPASAKTTTRGGHSELAFAFWPTSEELAPGVYRTTVWFLEVQRSTERGESYAALYHEVALCEDTTGGCVVQEVSDGSTDLKRTTYTVRSDLSRGHFEGTIAMQTYAPPGIPVGPATPTRVTADWRAYDAPVRTEAETTYDGKCPYRRSFTETSRQSRATARFGTEDPGPTRDASLVTVRFRSSEDCPGSRPRP